MEKQNLLLTVYSLQIKGVSYEVHAEQGLVTTSFYLSYSDSYPRVYLCEITNREIAEKKDVGELDEYLRDLVSEDDIRKLQIVNTSYPVDE